MDEHQFSECRKREKMSESTSTSEDLISRLPDEILCEILSFFPTKFAVTTSVLSKRWNHIWALIPNLDFTDDEDYFGKPPVNRTHFSNFVDRVLSLNKVSHVRKIYLHCDEDCDSSRVNAWISSIATRESKEFYLVLPMWFFIKHLDSLTYSLPHSFFTRKNLVTLSLTHVTLEVPTLVNFPCLKTIYLSSVQLLDDVSMKNLLFGCPVLHRLRIDRHVWEDVRTLYIFSSTLHHLTIHSQDCLRKFGYNVVIDAPNLRSLYLKDEIGVDYDMIDLSSLVKVVVDVELDEDELIDVEAFNVRLFGLLRKISHVEDLCFTTTTMRSFRYARIENMPMFKNLTRMKVDLGYHGISVFTFLFNCAPKLVTFILEKDDENHTRRWYGPIHVPQSFLSSLEYVEIQNFEQRDYEMGFVEYVLENAKILKKFSINSLDYDLEVETNLRKQLLSFPKSSSVCEIEYKNERW